jgi:hypothetical protein
LLNWNWQVGSIHFSQTRIVGRTCDKRQDGQTRFDYSFSSRLLYTILQQHPHISFDFIQYNSDWIRPSGYWRRHFDRSRIILSFPIARILFFFPIHCGWILTWNRVLHSSPHIYDVDSYRVIKKRPGKENRFSYILPPSSTHYRSKLSCYI